jgi:hypothetical protein
MFGPQLVRKKTRATISTYIFTPITDRVEGPRRYSDRGAVARMIAMTSTAIRAGFQKVNSRRH